MTARRFRRKGWRGDVGGAGRDGSHDAVDKPDGVLYVYRGVIIMCKRFLFNIRVLNAVCQAEQHRQLY